MKLDPFRFWSQLSLLGRLLTTAGIALIGAAALMLYSLASQETTEAGESLKQQLQEDLAGLPVAMAESLVVGDYATLQQNLDRRVHRQGVVELRYVDTSGAVVDSTSPAPARYHPRWFANWSQLHDLTGEAEVTVGDYHYGRVYVTLSAESPLNQVWRHVTAQFSIMVVAITLAFVGIGMVLRSSLHSVRALNLASVAVAQGDLTVRVAPGGSPELRNSIEAFNHMVQTITEARQRLTVEKERLQVTLASIGDAVITTDRTGHVDYINPVAEALTGWRNEDAQGMPVLQVFNVINENGRTQMENPVERVFRDGRVVELADHALLISYDGKEWPIADSAAPIRASENGEILGAVLVFRDQTGERERYKQMQLSGSVFSHAQEGIMITDADAVIISVNPAFTVLTGYTAEEAIGQRPSILSSGLHRPEFYAEMWATTLETGQWRGEVWNRRKNGELFAELLTITAVPSEVGGLGHYVGVFSDITELKSHQQRLERIAHYDALTHLPNRVLLADRLQVALAHARRLDTMLAVCYLDLDGFKPVNDQYGHEAGDRLLVEIASRLTMTLRAGDTVARLGGDEFVILLSGLRDVDECRITLDRLLKVVAQPYDIGGQKAAVSASIGVALYPSDDTDPDTLMRHADQAMYVAKESGRNRYHLFDPEHDRRARAHREAVSRIEEALAMGEFTLYFQPKVDMRHGKVVGAEALIRWNHPLRGLLPPAEFLPFIENSDFLASLDEWVIEHALARMEVWQKAGLHLPVSVNVSARLLQRKDMAARLAEALSRHATVSPRDFEIEILETSALDDILHVTSLIEECRQLGVRFALDDFGTGYSSLSYFKRLPAETLKIDQSFVRDMLRDTEDLAIVEGVIGLAEAFQRKVIAEGVETVAHGILLLHLGCDLGQGYGIARPMPADAVPDWVASWRADPRWAEAAQSRWQRQDLPLLVAEFDHQLRVDHFANWMRGDGANIQPLMPSFDERGCPFVRWLNGQGLERYGDQPVFGAIRAAQRQIQLLSAELANLKQSGRAAAGCERLPEIESLSQTLLELLRKLPRSA